MSFYNTKRVRTMSATTSARDALEDFDGDLQFILGRPCFMFIKEAQIFRSLGFEIEHQAEAEQAFFIHKMLMFYLQDKDNWRGLFTDYMTENINRAKAALEQST